MSWIERHPYLATARALGGCAAAVAAVVTGRVLMDLFCRWLCS